MSRLMRHRSPTADAYFERITAAADYSKLWIGLAGLMAAVGGERGRRAAANGLMALGVTSAIVNGPFKLFFRRPRPGVRRRLRRNPRTTSFPSGHSASAFAFATAASRVLPEAGGVLFPLAASVAFSRVYLGAHYPTDVVAGAAVGTAIGRAAPLGGSTAP
jgi:membrane-associated phospholipid phosphatase